MQKQQYFSFLIMAREDILECTEQGKNGSNLLKNAEIETVRISALGGAVHTAQCKIYRDHNFLQVLCNCTSYYYKTEH